MKIQVLGYVFEYLVLANLRTAFTFSENLTASAFLIRVTRQ